MPLNIRLFYPSGALKFRDGTRYRIDGGRVSWMRDRNGNQVTFGGGAFVTDSLNRQVNVTPASGSTTYDEISYNGVGGAPRAIRIHYNSLSNLLRPNSGYAVQTHAQLFPGLNSASTSTYYDPTKKVAEVELPDGRRYKFFYNPYGELARVEFPTGGAYEYDWAGGAYADDELIYRWVTQRRVYKDKDSATPERKENYDRGDPVNGNQPILMDTLDANDALLARSKHYFYGDAYLSVAPDPARPSGVAYAPWKEGREYQTEVFDVSGGVATLKNRVEHTWQQPTPGGRWPLTQAETSDGVKANNPQITATTTTLVDANLVTKQRFSYDQHNNQTDVHEYDFGAGAPLSYATRHTHTDFLTTGTSSGVDYADQNGSHIRSLPQYSRVYAVSASNGSEVLVAQSELRYDETSLLSYGTVAGWNDPATTARGNATTVRSWLDTTNTYIETRAQYDQLGNVRYAWDARGFQSQIEYASNYAYAYPTKTISPVPDTSGANGTNTELVSTSTYDFSTGLVTAATDANGQTTSMEYNDPLNRLTKVTHPNGGAISHWYDRNQYGDYVGTRTKLDNARETEGFQFSDGLGRPTRSFQFDPQDASRQWLTTDTEYDALGRVRRVSNPYRSTGSNSTPAGPWTTMEYDALGRAKTVTTSDSAQMVTNYNGAEVTVTDQDGKKRRSKTDALGRLVSVVEAPDVAGYNHETTYQYSALDNLTKVTQGGQTRSFGYDSLSRLTSAANPETENRVVTYQYDANGNLEKKTDARGVVTDYAYDALNRVKNRSYTGGSVATPAVTYFYDGAGAAIPVADARGQLTKVSSAGVSVTNYDEFDVMGRVKRSSQVTGGQTYTMSYGYDLAGNLTSQTYPSGRLVSTGIDAVGRVSGVSGLKGTEAKTYASAMKYAAHGAVEELRLGNNLYESTSFNTRLQPSRTGLGASATNTGLWRLDYDYGTTNNNGNLRTQSITVPGLSLLTQSYAYDALNRVQQAQEQSGASWRQTFIYDRFGNRRLDAAQTTVNVLPVNNPVFNPATNRYVDGQGYSYDTAGNLTVEPGGAPYSYDAENRLVSAGTGATYSYDGDGRRVKKVAGVVSTIFVYSVMGQMLAEYTSGSAEAAAGTSYVTGDHLGSTRVVTDAAGNIRTRHDYLPFGEEVQGGTGGRGDVQGYRVQAPGDARQKFATYERDNETGLDFARSRYYASTQGRFTSPDEFTGGAVDVFAAVAAANPTFYADLTNPQSLNKYQYAYNNPLRYNDPSGHCPDCPQQGESWWESIQSYFNSLGQRLLRQASPQSDPHDEPRVPGPLNMSRGEIVEKHSQMVGTGMDLNYAVMELVDPTGGIGVMRRLAKQDNTGAAVAGGGMMLGATGGFGGVTLREAKSLVGGWGAGSFNTVANSIRFHAGKHGSEVGARNVWQYLRKAEAFARNLRGARTSQLENGATRYMKNGRYVIKDEDGKIISYGLERQ